MKILVPLFFAIEAAIFGSLVVAIPCAIVWGHHGPDWPLIPLAVLALFFAVFGWRFGTRVARNVA